MDSWLIAHTTVRKLLENNWMSLSMLKIHCHMLRGSNRTQNKSAKVKIKSFRIRKREVKLWWQALMHGTQLSSNHSKVTVQMGPGRTQFINLHRCLRKPGHQPVLPPQWNQDNSQKQKIIILFWNRMEQKLSKVHCFLYINQAYPHNQTHKITRKSTSTG